MDDNQNEHRAYVDESGQTYYHIEEIEEKHKMAIFYTTVFIVLCSIVLMIVLIIITFSPTFI